MKRAMKEYGIRNAKARLSEIARAAASGKCSLITDNRKPVALIGPPPGYDMEMEILPQPVEAIRSISDAAAFRKALLGAPYPLELDF